MKVRKRENEKVRKRVNCVANLNPCLCQVFSPDNVSYLIRVSVR